MMNLKNNLYNIRSELESIPSREITFENCVKEKLSKSIDIHSQYIKRICDYLKVRDSMKVLKYTKEFNKKRGRKTNNDKID